MTITTNTTDRKALAKAIAEELGTTARYLGLPSYGYQIGDFTVDHDGNIIGEDFGALQDFLRRNGYVNDEPAADQEALTEAQPDEEAPADSEAEPITQMDISIPARNAAVAQLKNLIFMLHSRQTAEEPDLHAAQPPDPDQPHDRQRLPEHSRHPNRQAAGKHTGNPGRSHQSAGRFQSGGRTDRI